MKNIKKRTKIIAIASILLVIVVFGYLIVTQRFSADVFNKGKSNQVPLTAAQIKAIVEAHIKSIPLSATALIESANTGVRPYRDEKLVLTTLDPFYLKNVSSELQTDCNKLFIEKYTSDQIAVGKSYEIVLPNWAEPKCTYEVLGTMPGNLTLKAIYTSSRKFEISLPSKFQESESINSGNEVKKYAMNLLVNSESKFGIENKKLVLQTPKIDVSGNFSNYTILDMKAEENLLKSVSNSLSVDSGSSWKVTTSGLVDYGVEGTFELKNYDRSVSIDKNGYVDSTGYTTEALINNSVKLTKLEFCTKGCKVSIRETLNIKADKKDATSTGKVTSWADHEEIYNGFGQGDLNTKTISWKELALDKTDNRKWSQDLTYADGKVVKYTGSIDTKGTFLPLQTKKQDVISTVKRDVIVSYNPASKTIISSEQKASVTKNEKNKDGVITRTGTSSFSNCYNKTQCNERNGVFDSVSDTVKLTAPKNLVGQREADPFLLLYFTNYTKDIFAPGSLYVPGLFTASYKTEGNLATIATRSAKLLPEKIYVFRSYDKDDPTFAPDRIEPIEAWLDSLKERQIVVVNVDTTTKDKMKKALSELKSGTWVFNMGHGAPDGLSLGMPYSLADKSNFISYDEMQTILKSKGVKIDVFAGQTCYSGRSNLADIVIGSTGIGLANYNGALGNLFGVGTNGWNMSTIDLVAALNEIIAKSPKNPSVTPKVSLPVKSSVTPIVSPKVTSSPLPSPLVSPKISPTVSLPIMPSVVPTVTPKVTLPPMLPSR